MRVWPSRQGFRSCMFPHCLSGVWREICVQEIYLRNPVTYIYKAFWTLSKCNMYTVCYAHIIVQYVQVSTVSFTLSFDTLLFTRYSFVSWLTNSEIGASKWKYDLRSRPAMHAIIPISFQHAVRSNKPQLVRDPLGNKALRCGPRIGFSWASCDRLVQRTRLHTCTPTRIRD